MNHQSEIELLLTAASPPGGEHHERFARPHALAELQRRGTDMVALAARVRALMAELRRLPDRDLDFMSITSDAEGLFRLAWHVEAGTDPLPNFPAPGVRPRAGAARPVKRDAGPAPAKRAEPNR